MLTPIDRIAHWRPSATTPPAAMQTTMKQLPAVGGGMRMLNLMSSGEDLLTYTLWLVGALLALIAEFMSGTFYLLVVSVALAAAGIGSLAGATEAICWLLASLTGTVGVFAVARWRARQALAGRQHAASRNDDPDLGQVVSIIALQGRGMARVHYRGTEWQARLDEQHDWQAGAQAIISGRDGNVLLVSPTPTEAQ